MTTKSCGTWQVPERSALDGVQDPKSKYCEEDGFHALHVESVQFVYCRCLFAMPLLRSIFSGCHCSNADLARSDDLPVNASGFPEPRRQRRCHVRFTSSASPRACAWRRPPLAPNLGSRCPVKATFVFKHVGLQFFKPHMKSCQKSRFGKFCCPAPHGCRRSI